VSIDMNPLAKKLALLLYLAMFGAIVINYILGLGWFGPYDKLIVWGCTAFSLLVGRWLKSRAESKAQSGDVVVEALDAQGAVRSDPRARRFIWQTISGVSGVTILLILALAYRDRNRIGLDTYALVGVVMVIIVWRVCWNRFGNISEIEGDDGVTLTFRRRGEIIPVPWRQVESVEVSRPYTFWQVILKVRYLDTSASQTVRFLPLGWRKMTPASAEKLQAALDERRTSQPA